jgi:plastocyanin
MQHSRTLTALVAIALAAAAAGCGKKQQYKGGETPPAAEGGTRDPGTDISSLDELREVQVRITPEGFEPPDVAIESGDTVIWRNKDSKPRRVRRVPGPGGEFRSRRLRPGESYHFTFVEDGKVRVETDTKPKSRMTVTIIQ